MSDFFSKIASGSWSNRLTVRFSVVIGLSLLLMSSLATLVSVQFERHSLVNRLEDQAIRFADLLAANVATSLFTFNQANIDAVVAGFSSDEMIRFLEVRETSGKVIAVKGAQQNPGEIVTATRYVKYSNQPVGRVSVSLSTESVEASLRGYWWLAVLREGLGLLLVSLVLTALVRREVSRPIQQVANGLRDIACGEGDLTKRIEHASRNEIGSMAQWFNDFADKLSLIIVQVREATNAVSAAATQVSSSAQDLSRGTSEQAASVEETTASLEEMHASITQNAENSRQMEQTALKGAHDVEESSKAVTESLDAMKTIAIVSQKGGAGKTTLAIHLAVAATYAGMNAAVIDLDPQASSAKWADRRRTALPVVISAHASRLAHVLATAKTEGGELAIIDTAPHSDNAALEAVN